VTQSELYAFEEQSAFAVTGAMQCAFRNNSPTRMEFLELIALRGAVAGVREPGGYACLPDET
jgi:hypothetical protein